MHIGTLCIIKARRDHAEAVFLLWDVRFKLQLLSVVIIDAFLLRPFFFFSPAHAVSRAQSTVLLKFNRKAFGLPKSRLPLNITLQVLSPSYSFCAHPGDSLVEQQRQEKGPLTFRRMYNFPFNSLTSVRYEITLRWIRDVCWPFSCLVRVRCSVTKSADGYLYTGWLTFKVRWKSMQGFLYCCVDF